MNSDISKHASASLQHTLKCRLSRRYVAEMIDDVKLSFQEKHNEITVGDATWALNRPILDARIIDQRVFVLFDYMVYPKHESSNNLEAYDFDGNRLWVISEHPLPGATAAYTNFIGSSNQLVVGNFAGFTCRIDPETGKLAESEFTK